MVKATTTRQGRNQTGKPSGAEGSKLDHGQGLGPAPFRRESIKHMTATPRLFRSKKQRRQQVQYLAKTVQPLSDWGHGPGRGHKAPKTRRKKRPQGTGGQKYLMQRIARDHPDVLERAKQGEFLSVRQAGIAAGIVKGKGREVN